MCQRMAAAVDVDIISSFPDGLDRLVDGAGVMTAADGDDVQPLVAASQPWRLVP
jgi:hypothetical protein